MQLPRIEYSYVRGRFANLKIYIEVEARLYGHRIGTQALYSLGKEHLVTAANLCMRISAQQAP